MANVKQKVYLITEQQRNGVLNYLLDRPYREVAVAIQILAKAPTTEVNLEVPDEQLKDMVTQEESEVNMNNTIEGNKLELVTSSAEESSLFSRV